MTKFMGDGSGVSLAMPFCIADMGHRLHIAGQPFGVPVIFGIVLVLSKA